MKDSKYIDHTLLKATATREQIYVPKQTNMILRVFV